MSNSSTVDFKLLAAEADNEREKEMKTRKEAQMIKLEIDRQNNEDDPNEQSIDSSDVITDLSDATSLKYVSRTSSVETGAIEAKIKLLEDENRECKLSYIQLYEEKEVLSYQLSLLRDQMDDLNGNYRKIQKELCEKRKENSFQNFQVNDLNNRINFLTNAVDTRDKLIVDNHLMLCNSDLSADVQVNNMNSDQNIAGVCLLPKDLVDQLKELSANSLESCIRTLFEERNKNIEEVLALKKQVTEEKQVNDSEYTYSRDNKKRRNEVKSQAQDFKRQIQLYQQKVTGLEADVIRLEGQVKRYKSMSESCEKQEEELKNSKRKYQKEAREAQNKIEDLKSENSGLIKKLEKYTKQKTKKENS